MPKKMTHSDYLNKLQRLGIEVVPIEQYRGCDVNILHRCVCGTEWSVRPANVLHGGKCKNCQRKSIGSHLRLSHEEFVRRNASKINENVKILGKYRSANEPILCECLVCGEKYNPPASSVAEGKMHRKCAEKIAGKNLKKNQEQFEREVYQNNPSIRVLGEYAGANSPVKSECLICGYIWEPIAASIRKGQGCPSCAGMIPVTESEFLNRSQSNTKVTVIGKFFNSRTKVRCRCNTCGADDLFLLPYQIYGDTGCKYCARKHNGDSLKKSTEQFVKEMAELHPTIEVLSDYHGADKQVICKCGKCGHIWYPVAGSLISQNADCPICKSSHGERLITNWLNKHKIAFVPNHKFADLKGVGGKPLSYDFYIPFMAMAIEYNGKQHEEAIEHFGGEEKLEKQKEHDRRKEQYASEHGIKLIVIWYYDEGNINQILAREILNSETVETVISA